MNPKRGCVLLPWLAAAVSLLVFRPGISFAASDAAKQMSVSLNAGETYVIDDAAPGATPGVRVISNPHALIVHNEEPGKVVLLGAEAGEWAVTINTKSGDVTYDVTVSSVANTKSRIAPGTAPASIAGTGATTGSAAPVVAKLDPGTGPVSGTGDAAAAPSPASAASPASAPSPAPSIATSTVTDTIASAPAAAPAPAPGPEASAAPAPEAAPASPAAIAAANPVIPSQAASAAALSDEKFRTNPSVALTGADYATTAVSGGTHPLPPDTILMMTGTSQIIDFPSRIRRVSIADTKIADIQVVSPFQINLIGHKPGFTTLAVWNNQGTYDEREVRIDAGGKQQVLLNCVVAELDRSNIENQGVNLSVALANYGVSMFGMPGAVATPFSPQTTITTTTPFGTSSSMGSASLPPGGSLIPMLLSQNMTYGLAAQNSNVLTQTFFQYLENHNMAKILAEPHLLANSGEEAKFLSGGEIPIVIAQALNTSIVFKQFGTSVQFVPTVVGRKDLELLVKPEVSQPDYAHGVQMFGFTVPAFVTRRAETMVRMKDNQTLILAGLILHNPISNVNKVPYLGDVPYLGGLFRTTSYTNQETDLVMSVTPQIVNPLPEGAQVFNPYDAPNLTAESVRTRSLAQPNAARPRF